MDRERAAPRRGPEQVALQPRPDHPAEPAVVGRVAVAAERAVGARVGLGGRHQGGEVVGLDPVVGVEEQDPAAAGLAQAGVAGGGGAEVGRQGEQPEARRPRPRPAAAEGAGAVGGGVVDDDRLEVGQGLGAEAGQGVAERGLGVVGRDDHGDARAFGRGGRGYTLPREGLFGRVTRHHRQAGSCRRDGGPSTGRSVSRRGRRSRPGPARVDLGAFDEDHEPAYGVAVHDPRRGVRGWTACQPTARRPGRVLRRSASGNERQRGYRASTRDRVTPRPGPRRLPPLTARPARATACRSRCR